MREVLYALSVSLDGIIEAPSGEPGWSSPDEERHQHVNDLERIIHIC